MCPIHVKSQSSRRDHHSSPSPHTHISLKSILDPCQRALERDTERMRVREREKERDRHTGRQRERRTERKKKWTKRKI